jgi:hypothetical protein
MSHSMQEGMQEMSLWAGLAAGTSPLKLLILVILLWSVVSVLLTAGLGAWIATKRALRHRR